MDFYSFVKSVDTFNILFVLFYRECVNDGYRGNKSHVYYKVYDGQVVAWEMFLVVNVVTI